MRRTTIDKEKAILKVFHRLLRSGKDWTTESMYEEAGNACFMARGTAGHVVRKHYRTVITDDMKSFVSGMNGIKHEEKVRLFVKEFEFCKRESRLLIRFIKSSK